MLQFGPGSPTGRGGRRVRGRRVQGTRGIPGDSSPDHHYNYYDHNYNYNITIITIITVIITIIITIITIITAFRGKLVIITIIIIIPLALWASVAQSVRSLSCSSSPTPQSSGEAPIIERRTARLREAGTKNK